ncbi:MULTISPECIES: SNF2-related protein [Paraburkholderia]|uniref:SNF2-related protein n=1 Tax=Paraburkholderia TaxID=1822464 RepID=UPI00225AD816|nr:MULTISPECIES: SNF2-related protein [Paraburkholderia]MCX4177368.1 SNF2-related protein [Paraburkholderia madseniana]MDQ6465356.1 SNF2-related protein [Paraburkholderia madseniana]
MFKLFKQAKERDIASWNRRWSDKGIVLTRRVEKSGAAVDGTLIQAYLTQLADDGLVRPVDDGFLLDWESLYVTLERPDYSQLRDVLRIPAFTDTRPSLRSVHSLADREFAIAIDGWHVDGGREFRGTVTGPIMAEGTAEALMRPAQWKLFNAVVAFSRRNDEDRSDLGNRQGWGRIRKLALEAEARLDDFLYRSVVLSPEKLNIGLRRSADVVDDHVIEIEPGFEGAPDDWLDAFDRVREIRDRYDITTREGVVQVLVTPKVKTVLREIKRLPGRRVAGSRAQAFLLNPYAALGADANDVIEESQFERAREDAGLDYERFVPTFERNAAGYPLRVGLLIETASASGPTSSKTHWLDDDELSTFVAALSRSLALGHQLLAWQGYDLALQGDSEQQLKDLSAVLSQRRTLPTMVSYAQVHDLGGYSARIESIGVEKPYHSPYIAKKDEGEGWFPDNILPVIVYQSKDGGELVAVPTNKLAIEKLKNEVEAADAKGVAQLDVPWLKDPISVSDAKEIISTFESVFSDLESGKPFDPANVRKPPSEHGPKKQLVLRANIQALEYEELRREALQAVPARPKLPLSIRPEFALLPHQQTGLAWMQHLFSLQTDYQVRGAILADDMGLGKTFQLLALMAWLLEQEPTINPMLVVAPVSLLENWAEEANKFFQPGALPLLTAYGDSLAEFRVPRGQIDQRLQAEDGLVKFLKPNWIGDAKVVLTTYETMRDLEFSFAAQKWSLMVCDEAQRIKNPAAMVTRAAKKQNVAFRIACTGTPVENTLADMWCLFDYVQPGLLGALNDFGERYRKPIEAKTDEEKSRVDELRARISPQILRRLKTEVDTGLPPKIVVEDCRQLSISGVQRNLYAKAVDGFKRRKEPNHTTPFKNHLGLLHYLRLVCTDPRVHGLSVFKPEPLGDYRAKSPKLDWLLKQLTEIRAKGEKAIVFCEFREIQRLLQHYIEADLGFRPDIINGDTSASSSHVASRQKRIKAFQDAPGFGVLVLSPVAVGFGVNIQAANHVIHYSRTWNPAKEDQATDRAYRINQKKPVYVYYPTVCADDFTTFDVKLDQLLAHKRGLSEDMLNGAGDVAPGDFSIADVVPQSQSNDLDERITLDMALRMGWQHFECLVGALWNKRGYDCYRTPGTNDNGVDVVAIDGNRGQLIQAKTSGIDGTKLGWDAVKEVVAGEAFYRRRHPNVSFEKVCVTNQFFNSQAQENANLNSVELLDQKHLGDLLRAHETTMLEVERILFAEWESADALG